MLPEEVESFLQLVGAHFNPWIGELPIMTDHELARLTMGDAAAGYPGCTGCAHSDSPTEANLNCVMKARGAWWMFARIAGWDGE